MAAPLSFSPDFFLPPQSLSPSPRDTSHPPCTVLEALELKREHDPGWWEELAHSQFGCAPRFLDADMVLERVLEVNTCASLTSLPVRVYIDTEGDFQVEVHDVGR